MNYDQNGRIIQIGEARLIYANSNFSSRVTHVVRPDSVRYLYYDLGGMLFAIKDDKRTSDEPVVYYVVTRADGTPKYIFDASGDLVRDINRSYFGHMITDTRPSFELLIGHRGEICVGHLCFSSKTSRWRQILTGDEVAFGKERAQLDALISIEPGLSFDIFENLRGLSTYNFCYHFLQ